MVERIRAAGDDPSQYVDIAIKVPERKYTAWPESIRAAFAPARTVKTGKPSFRLSSASASATGSPIAGRAGIPSAPGQPRRPIAIRSKPTNAVSAAPQQQDLARHLRPAGIGKTSLLKTLPAADTVCLDLEAGMKSVQDWPGDSIPVRTFADCRRHRRASIGGINPAADPNGFFSEGHYQHRPPDLSRPGVADDLPASGSSSSTASPI